LRQDNNIATYGQRLKYMLARFRGIGGRLLLIPIVAVIALISVGAVAVQTVGSVMLEYCAGI
jgi:hypothetical protein